MTDNEISKLDEVTAKRLREVGAKVPAVLHGYVKPETLAWLNEQGAALATEIVKPLLGLDTPPVIVSVDVDRRGRLGHYKIGRDGLGLAWRISINVLHLTRPRGDVVRTLLHEILHAVQHRDGKPGKGNYHNAEFIAWCERAGIPTNAKGHDKGTTKDGPFDAYCKRHKLEGTEALLSKREAPRPRGSKMKKWTCPGCETNIRAAVEIDVTCNECNKKFFYNDK